LRDRLSLLLGDKRHDPHGELIGMGIFDRVPVVPSIETKVVLIFVFGGAAIPISPSVQSQP
jgi:hypothetical protein